MKTWLAIALQRPVVVRALRVAAVIGTLLGVINHWDVMATGIFTQQIWAQIALTYLVPYCVSTYSSVEALRERIPGNGTES